MVYVYLIRSEKSSSLHTQNSKLSLLMSEPCLVGYHRKSKNALFQDHKSHLRIKVCRLPVGGDLVVWRSLWQLDSRDVIDGIRITWMLCVPGTGQQPLRKIDEGQSYLTIHSLVPGATLPMSFWSTPKSRGPICLANSSVLLKASVFVAIETRISWPSFLTLPMLTLFKILLSVGGGMMILCMLCIGLWFAIHVGAQETLLICA